jgi:hypothetical protein
MKEAALDATLEDKNRGSGVTFAVDGRLAASGVGLETSPATDCREGSEAAPALEREEEQPAARNAVRIPARIPHRAAGETVRAASAPAACLFLEIQILGIIIPHVGFFELRIVEVHFLVFLVAVFFNVFRFAFKRLKVVEIVVLGTPSKTPLRVAPARHETPPTRHGNIDFFANISWQPQLSTKLAFINNRGELSDKKLPETGVVAIFPENAAPSPG